MKLIFMFYFLLICSSFNSIDADPQEYISIRWDIIAWIPDGYMVEVTLNNTQRHRTIDPPGWSLGWTWASDEFIHDMTGSQTIDQGDCSNFTGDLPHCCSKDPIIVDLLPRTPFDQQIPNCCKGGVLSSMEEDPTLAVTAFQIAVGNAGTTKKTVQLQKNFTLTAPGSNYTCGPAKIVTPTHYVDPSNNRVTQSFMTWSVRCICSQSSAQTRKGILWLLWFGLIIVFLLVLVFFSYLYRTNLRLYFVIIKNWVTRIVLNRGM